MANATRPRPLRSCDSAIDDDLESVHDDSLPPADSMAAQQRDSGISSFDDLFKVGLIQRPASAERSRGQTETSTPRTASPDFLSVRPTSAGRTGNRGGASFARADSSASPLKLNSLLENAPTILGSSHANHGGSGANYNVNLDTELQEQPNQVLLPDEYVRSMQAESVSGGEADTRTDQFKFNCEAENDIFDPASAPDKNLKAAARWKQAFNLVNATIILHKRFPWFQLAGHSSQFELHHSPEFVLKRSSKNELAAFKALAHDPLSEFSPSFGGTIVKNDEEYMKLQNLLFGFTTPAAMDMKMGFRTFLPEDVSNRKPRLDLLAKLKKLDKTTVTPDEEVHGVTKLRYMLHREQTSTTHSLGFRIEAVKEGGMVDAKTLKGGQITTRQQVLDELKSYIRGDPVIRDAYIARLQELRAALVESTFFSKFEIVGSSLLLLHDNYGKVGVWIIDFAKSIPHPDQTFKHDTFTDANLELREDGYLLGLDNLISTFSDCLEPS